jgi:hypothetical protein
MSDRSLTIVFRNPHPQRSPIRAKLHVLRVDGSIAHTDLPNQANSINSKQARLPE